MKRTKKPLGAKNTQKPLAKPAEAGRVICDKQLAEIVGGNEPAADMMLNHNEATV